ncbi:hypothetical protein FKM82_024979 [Ascaphus truei]
MQSDVVIGTEMLTDGFEDEMDSVTPRSPFVELGAITDPSRSSLGKRFVFSGTLWRGTIGLISDWQLLLCCPPELALVATRTKCLKLNPLFWIKRIWIIQFLKLHQNYSCQLLQKEQTSELLIQRHRHV